MRRTYGTIVRGIRAPVVKTGDDVVEITVDSLKNYWEAENCEIKDRDIIGITESMVARSQGNYVTVDDIAEDVKSKFGDESGDCLPDSEPEPLLHHSQRNRPGD